MLRNYFKVALRNLRQSKLYSFINIAGLSLGMASCTVIFLYVQQELSYDRHNEKADRIYRLTEVLHLPKEDNNRAVTSPPMAPKLQAAFPEIEKSVRLSYSGRKLSYQDRKIYDAAVMYADSTLFDVFTFSMIAGNLKNALINPYSVVLTESAAKKYFGNEPALGKVMKLSDTINITVTAIIKDVPVQSHFSFDCVLSRSTINELSNNEPEDNWFHNGFFTYFLLSPKSDYHKLEIKMSAFTQKELAEERKTRGLWYDLKLQPLTSIHLHSNLNSEIKPNSDISYVYIFSAAALLILLIACSNFVNLSTAKSLNRSKEIGLRKVIGALRSQLIIQFLSESFLFACIAGIFAIGIVTISLPFFNSFTGKTLSLDFLHNRSLLITYVGIIVITGLLAGIYPAFLMSSFTPVKSIKGNIRYGWQDIVLRKGLVVFQFTIAIILIIGTTLVLQQLHYMQNQKLGLNKEQVLEIPLNNADLSKSDILLRELRSDNGVENTSLTDFSFKGNVSSIAMLPEGARENEITSQPVIAVDENFIPTFHISLAAGRNFSKSFATDSTEGFIVNEKAVSVFKWGAAQQAIGKNIDWGLGKKGKVIGVVKDFNFASLHENIKPLIIHVLPEWYQYVAIRVKPQELQKTLKSVESSWKKIATNSPFTYSFIDNDFANLYKAEQNMESVLTLFTILSVFVACLGLFGLAAFTIKQRFKEIGVRKVLGASTTGIARLLSKDFIRLVMISVVIASPIAWLAVKSWLQQFAYHVNINAWIFIGTAAVAIFISLVTVSFQAIRAAMANPVKSLRTE